MLRRSLLIALLPLLTGASACSATPPPSESDLAEAIDFEVVAPACDAVVDASTALAAAVATFVASPNEMNLRAAQAAWLRAHLVYRSKTAALRFVTNSTPKSMGDERFNDSAWLEATIAGTEPLRGIPRLSDRSFGILEYLLFERERAWTDGDYAPNPWKPAAETVARFVGDRGIRRRELAHLLARTIARVATELRDAWKAQRTAPPSEDPGEFSRKPASTQLVIVIDAALEEEGAVFAHTLGIPDAKAPHLAKVPSVRSGNTLPELQAAVAGIHALYRGACPPSDTGTCTRPLRLDSFLRPRDADFSKRWEAAQEATEAALQTLPSPLSEHLGDPEVRSVYRVLRTEHCSFSEYAFGVMGLTHYIFFCGNCRVCQWQE
jgi:predicted lipoprotein